VFRTVLLAKLACFGVAFAACYVVAAAIGLTAVRQTRARGLIHVVRDTGDGPATLPDLLAPLADRLPWRPVVLAAAAGIAVLVCAAQTASWQTYLLWLHGGPFGMNDPYFGRDVGFFVFTLPAYQALIDAAMGVVVLSALLATAVLWLNGALDFRRPGHLMP